MDKTVYNTYVAILKRELIAAMGCTEPIAIAYAGAVARKYLPSIPTKVVVSCSGNIIKNVKGVIVPNSGGMRGIHIAVLLGIVGGDADAQLSVIQNISDEDRLLAQKLLQEGICTTKLVEGVSNLFIVVHAEAEGHVVEVEIRDTHLNMTRLEVDGAILFQKGKEDTGGCKGPDPSLLNLKDMIRFAEEADLMDIAPIIRRQIEYNSAISAEGLQHEWGACIGKTLLENGDDCVQVRARAAAAAGSDARMNGCPMPVVINSGSGNQGITVTMPVVTYAKEWEIPEERLIRALALGNLTALYQKQYIGSLSAYCGATCAACGAAAGIVWLRGGNVQEIAGTITNTIATIGGIVCDGAKSSCAGKISIAVAAALDAAELAMKGHVYQPGEGLVKDGVENTVAAVGRMGRVGMRATDVEILHIMLEE